MSYIFQIKFDWNPAKNQWLKESRGITFDEIVWLIDEGYLRAVLNHPKKPHQKILVVEREGYCLQRTVHCGTGRHLFPENGLSKSHINTKIYRSPKMKKVKLNKEEAALEKEIENGEWVLVPDMENEITKIRVQAHNFLNSIAPQWGRTKIGRRFSACTMTHERNRVP